MSEKSTYEELERRISLLENESVKQRRMGNSTWQDEKIMRAFLDKYPLTASIFFCVFRFFYEKE